MRPIWQGGISFGLIYIPVNLFSASKARELEFRLLDKKDNSRIHYSKFRESDGKEVEKEDIVKGYEYEKGKFVIVDPEDFENANVKKSNAIEVHQFINPNEVPPQYFEKPYFLKPKEGAEKTYTLFLKALQKTKKAAIGTFVMKQHEHLVLLTPEENHILLTQLRFEEELKDPKELNIDTGHKVDSKELKTATDIIKLMEKPFDPKKYKDAYTNELKKTINDKLKNKKSTPKGSKPKPTEVADLMKELQKSLEKEKQKAKTKVKAK